MPNESQIPTVSHAASSRFATRLALFYGTLFGMTSTTDGFFSGEDLLFSDYRKSEELGTLRQVARALAA